MSYDQDMDLIKGEGLMIYIADELGELQPIAYATTHQLDRGTETIDTSSKMSGGWDDSMPGKKSWQLTTDSLISRTEGHLSYDTLEEMHENDEILDVVIGTPKNSEDFELDTTKRRREGKAIITSLTQTANNGELCTSSLSLQGKGKLVRKAGTGG